MLTVCHAENVDSRNGKAFSDCVIGAIELSEHDRGINLPETNTSEASDQHLSTSPCVGEKDCRKRVGNKSDCAVCTGQTENGCRVEPEAFVQDRLVILQSDQQLHSALRRASNIPQ